MFDLSIENDVLVWTKSFDVGFTNRLVIIEDGPIEKMVYWLRTDFGAKAISVTTCISVVACLGKYSGGCIEEKEEEARSPLWVRAKSKEKNEEDEMYLTLGLIVLYSGIYNSIKMVISTNCLLAVAAVCFWILSRLK